MMIAFAGQIASGKSTLSRSLAQRTGWSRLSFGEYVGECANRIGLDPNNRETLQDLGACLAKHPERFVDGFLKWAGEQPNMIVDGVRHVSILRALKSSTDGELRLVFVDTPVQVAETRFGGDLRLVRRHEVEAEIEALKPLADWVLADSTALELQRVIESLGLR